MADRRIAGRLLRLPGVGRSAATFFSQNLPRLLRRLTLSYGPSLDFRRERLRRPPPLPRALRQPLPARPSAKYKGSVLGLAWTLALPLALMLVYLVVFSRALEGEPTDARLLAVPALRAAACGSSLATSLQAGARSLVENAPLIRKVRFPRQLVPLSVVATQLVAFAAMLRSSSCSRSRSCRGEAGHRLARDAGRRRDSSCSWRVWRSPSPLERVFRDVELIVSAALLPWFFLTPILYQLDDLPGPRMPTWLVDLMHWGTRDPCRRGLPRPALRRRAAAAATRSTSASRPSSRSRSGRGVSTGRRPDRVELWRPATSPSKSPRLAGGWCAPAGSPSTSAARRLEAAAAADGQTSGCASRRACAAPPAARRRRGARVRAASTAPSRRPRSPRAVGGAARASSPVGRGGRRRGGTVVDRRGDAGAARDHLRRRPRRRRPRRLGEPEAVLLDEVEREAGSGPGGSGARTATSTSTLAGGTGRETRVRARPRRSRCRARRASGRRLRSPPRHVAVSPAFSSTTPRRRQRARLQRLELEASQRAPAADRRRPGRPSPAASATDRARSASRPRVRGASPSSARRSGSCARRAARCPEYRAIRERHSLLRGRGRRPSSAPR